MPPDIKVIRQRIAFGLPLVSVLMIRVAFTPAAYSHQVVRASYTNGPDIRLRVLNLLDGQEGSIPP